MKVIRLACCVVSVIWAVAMIAPGAEIETFPFT